MSTIPNRVDYQTEPSRYKHWKLKFEGPVATLLADFDENGGLREGYKLKLNSYDLGVDIELHDAVNRIRFEHPEVQTVVLTSAKEKVFCSGANIFMLGVSSHAWKVNFCKFTNETRNGLEDSSNHGSLKFLAAVNGACAGGGYEVALACDEIILVDDRSSAVSLPEVPLLGVLPGTGGITRVTDKRKVRHDLADIFCTTTEGVRGQKAKDWKLVDDIAKPAVFAQKVQERALELAKQSKRPGPGAKGIALTPITRTIEADALRYPHVTVEIDRAKRTATWTVKAPQGPLPADIAGIEAAGAAWAPLALARELDDAILSMRTNELDIGTWLIKTEGDAAAVLAMDAQLAQHADHWLVRETVGLLRRTFSRLDVSSRSLFALIEPGSCFAGSFLELALACDRSYMLILPDDAAKTPKLTVNDANFGTYPMATGQSRLHRRFYGDAAQLAAVRATLGQALDADAAFKLGLVT
ncbi:MAG: benzoyl-CoA-dihydrodiol lyase, partial [Rubrivivax sp.]|nr:benzoyl-CoA-dihydrodiol lyase [Rubrivivax sp.]